MQDVNNRNIVAKVQMSKELYFDTSYKHYCKEWTG